MFYGFAKPHYLEFFSYRDVTRKWRNLFDQRGSCSLSEFAAFDISRKQALEIAINNNGNNLIEVVYDIEKSNVDTSKHLAKTVGCQLHVCNVVAWFRIKVIIQHACSVGISPPIDTFLVIALISVHGCQIGEQKRLYLVYICKQ